MSFIQNIFAYLENRNRTPLRCNPVVIGSYSQYGEDLVIDAILGCKERGFYVDVGANDPELLNNTKRFYDRGWSGINVEPNPTLCKKLWNTRTRDAAINVGVGAEEMWVPFYIVSADTLSSFSREDAERNCRIFGERITSTVYIHIIPLSEVLSRNPDIDLLSVDVEGQELDVLKSNVWELYRPKVIVIEINHHGEEIQTYLSELKYVLVYSNHTNGIFVDTLWLDKMNGVYRDHR